MKIEYELEGRGLGRRQNHDGDANRHDDGFLS